MAYSTVSNWTTTEWNDEMQASAQKFAPLIMSAGASSVRFIRTGDLSFSVVTDYADEATGKAAQSKTAEIRGQAIEELPLTMASVAAGGVFATH